MSVDNKGDLKVDSWCLKIFLSNGEEKTLVDMPDDIASMIDEWLSELEEEVK
jgi:hypothetical protein